MMKLLSKAEIEEIFKRAQTRVQVACDEYHAHSALDNCLYLKTGAEVKPQDVVDICRLCEHINVLSQLAKPLIEALTPKEEKA